MMLAGRELMGPIGADRKGAIELMLMMLARLGPNGQGHRADAHDAGPFGAHRKGVIELMHMMLARPVWVHPQGAIELMLMMLARLRPTGKGPSS